MIDRLDSITNSRPASPGAAPGKDARSARTGVCRRGLLQVTVAAVALSQAAGAQEPPAKRFSLRGFATLGAVGADVRGADFVGNAFQPDGAGQTHDFTLGVDSKIGVQLDAALGSRFTAVVQLVAQHRYDGSYTPQIEWANLKYQVTPDFSLRLGRTVADQFMVSDARLVSYISPWVRPPQEVYGLAPLTNKDGLDATYRFGHGEIVDTVRASYGQTKLKVPGNSQVGEIKGTEFFDLNNTLEYGPGTLRVGYTSARGDYRTADLAALFGGFTEFGEALSAIPGLQPVGAQALALVDRYQLNDFPYAVMTIGGSYDRGAWLFMAEWAQVESSGLVLDATAWYAMSAYRVGKLTPYLSYAQLESTKPDEPGISLAGLPAPLARAAAALNSGLTAALDGAASAQDTVAAGIRWDLRSYAAFKLQYDHIDLGPGSSGRLVNVQPDFPRGSTVGVFSASVDFVF